MKIIILPRAEKQLRKLTKFDQIAVAQKIRMLGQLQSGEEKLSGFSNIYRVRVGNYRIVYRKAYLTCRIVLIGHRRDIYRMVKDLFG
jgi:mRNA interferase RelE/StbE